MATTSTARKRRRKIKQRARRSTPGMIFQPAGRRGSDRPFYLRFVDPRSGQRVAQRATVAERLPDGTTRERPATNASEAEEALARAVRGARTEALRDAQRGCRAVTIENLWKAIEPLAAARLAPRQFPNVKAQILRASAAFPGVPMCDIVKPSLVAYFHQIKAEGKRLAPPKGKKPGTGPLVPLSVATLVRHRAALGKLWDEAIQRRAALVNVPLSVPVSEFGKRQEREAAYFTPEQLAKLYADLPAPIAPLVTLLTETGARFAEIAGERRTVSKGKRDSFGGLTWACVAQDDSSVTLQHTKNGRSRTIPTTERARAVLRALRERRIVPLRGEDRVLAGFPTAHGYCLRAFHAALEVAGLPKAGFHALRHSYCAGLVAANVPLNVVMQLAGHSSLALTTRYARHAPASAAVHGVHALEAARASAGAAQTKPRKAKRTA